MKFITLAVKSLKEIIRDKQGLGYLILFPIVFVLVFGYAFGVDWNKNNPQEIVVLNYDKGTILTYGNISEEINFGKNFTELLRNLTYENSTIHLFEIKNATAEEAENLLMKRKIACIVIIPENFSDAMYAMINATIRKEITSSIGEMMIGGFKGTWKDTNTTNNTNITNIFKGLRLYKNGTLQNITALLKNGTLNATLLENGTLLADVEYFRNMYGFNTNQTFGKFISKNRTIPKINNITSTIIIKGDTGYIKFGMVQGILKGVIERYVEEVKEHVKVNVSKQFNRSTIQDKFVFTKVEGVSGTESFTTFDFMAPGFIVFALLMSAISIAVELARETEKKTLTRLKMTKVKSFDLMLGALISWTLMAVVQVLIIFTAILIMGFHWQGGWISIGLAVFIGIIAGISSLSLGLIISAFAKSSRHASTLGVLIAVPLIFLAGVFFPINKTIVEILPWGHAAEALRSVLTYGNFDILYNLEMMIILTIILFAIGVILFQKKKMKAES